MPDKPRDKLDRPLRDLRVSVTDRCNFRCTYCMPREVFGRGYEFLPQGEILTFEEIVRLVKVFTTLGATKIRLTGGEPLLRREIEKLVSMLAALPEVEDLALTTNGSLLAAKARSLKAAGLRRLTVSLDSLDEATFARMNDAACPLSAILRGIDAALSAGFSPIKLNMVVRRGVNDHEIGAMAQRFSGPDFILRFIEYMDVGNTNGWTLNEVVPGAEALRRLPSATPFQPLPANYASEVARRFRSAGGGEIGLINSVTQPFCGACSRARLSADGRLFTCLFSNFGWDLRGPLRSGADENALAQRIADIWRDRDDRYSELRAQRTAPVRKPEMSLLGG